MNISRILYRNESNKHEVEKDNNILLKEEDRPDASSSGDRTYRRKYVCKTNKYSVFRLDTLKINNNLYTLYI